MHGRSAPCRTPGLLVILLGLDVGAQFAPPGAQWTYDQEGGSYTMSVVGAFAGEGLTLTYGIQYLGNLEGVSDGEGSLIVAWAEQPMFDFNIYMSRAVAPDFPTTTGSLISAHTPAGFRLDPIMPNPVHGVATVTYATGGTSRVALELFDARGVKIRTLMHRVVPEGGSTFQWSTDGLAGGVYVIRMIADGFTASQRVVIH